MFATLVSFPCNAGKAAQTNENGRKKQRPYRSPEQLRRELRPVSAGYGSQSLPVSPCRLPLTYFPPSLLLIGSPVAIDYPRK